MMGSKIRSGREAVERELGLGLRTAGEDGEIELAGELFEHARARHPLLAQDQAIVAVAEEDGLEVILHVLRRERRLPGRADRCGARASNRHSSRPGSCSPESVRGRGCDAGEMLDGLGDGLAVAFGDVHQHAIHVEDQMSSGHWLQISSSAVSRRRVCSRVPTVMRTQPAAS